MKNEHKTVRGRRGLRKAAGMALASTTRAITESLESRMLLSISATAGNTSAIEGQSTNVGYLDPAGPVLIDTGQNWTVDHVRTTGTTALTVNGSLKIAPAQGAFDASHISVINDLTIGPGGQLDLTNNAIIIDVLGGPQDVAAEYNKICGYVANGANGYGTGNYAPRSLSWNGLNGIVSSMAAVHSSNFGIGVIQNTDGSNVIWQDFAGQTNLTTNDIIVAYTQQGDANLSGNTDFNDFVSLSSHFFTQNGTWQQGNFNYDGQVDFNDFVQIATNFGQQVLQSTLADGSSPPVYLADFKDSSDNQIGDFTASINWNDPNSTGTTTGIISPDGHGGFDVLGSHVYTNGTNATTYHPVVTITNNNPLYASSDSVTAAITIFNAPISATATTAQLDDQNSVSDQVVANFFDPNKVIHLSDLSATIDWNDPNAPGADPTGTITSVGSGLYTVSGSHQYSTADTRLIHVTIQDRGGDVPVTVNTTINPLAIPTINSSTVAQNSISLSWAPPTSASAIRYYQIYRKSPGGFVSSSPLVIPYATTNTNTPSFTDTNILLNATYDYYVVAVDALGHTSPIPDPLSPNDTTGWSAVSTLPSAPTHIGAATTAGGILLTWDPLPQNESTTNYNCLVYRHTASSPNPVLVGPTVTTNSFLDPAGGLSNGQTYYYTVVTQNGTLTSAPSLETSATYIASGPLTPTQLGASFSNDAIQTLTFNWTLADSSDHFFIQQSTDGVTNWTPVPWLDPVNATSNTFTSGDGAVTASNNNGAETVAVTGVSQPYFYRIAAASGSAASGWTASGWNNTPVPLPNPADSSIPVSATITSGPTSVQLQWLADPAGMYYRVFRRVSGTADWGKPLTILAGTATGLTDSTASAGTAYDYLIREARSDPFGEAFMHSQILSAVAPLQLQSSTIQNFEGAAFTVPVASFTINVEAPLTGWTATIDWGDGNSSTLDQLTNTQGTCAITASHTYSRKNNYTTTITIFEGNGISFSVQGVAIIAAAPVPPLTSGTISGVEGISLTGAVATFASPIDDADAIYTATIVWGDGQNSTGTITKDAGGWEIDGTHLYASAPMTTPQVTLKLIANNSSTVTFAAVISDAPLSEITVPKLNLLSNTNYSQVVVGHFTDADPKANASFFGNPQITITDPTNPIPGNVVPDGSGGFYVEAALNNLSNGTYVIQVPIQDQNGASLQIDTQISVTTPSTVQNLSATATTDGNINLEWQYDSNATSFDIQDSTDGGKNFTTILHNVAPQYIPAPGSFAAQVDELTGLAPDTTYNFRIYAYNIAGVGAYSNIYAGTTAISGGYQSVPVQTLILPAAESNLGNNLIFLQAGVHYKLVVTGQVDITLNGVLQGYGDAQYMYHKSAGVADSPAPVINGLLYYGVVSIGNSSDALNLLYGGKANVAPYWGTYNANHTYSIDVVGTGEYAEFDYNLNTVSGGVDVTAPDSSNPLQIQAFQAVNSSLPTAIMNPHFDGAANAEQDPGPNFGESATIPGWTLTTITPPPLSSIPSVLSVLPLSDASASGLFAHVGALPSGSTNVVEILGGGQLEQQVHFVSNGNYNLSFYRALSEAVDSAAGAGVSVFFGNSENPNGDQQVAQIPPFELPGTFIHENVSLSIPAAGDYWILIDDTSWEPPSIPPDFPHGVLIGDASLSTVPSVKGPGFELPSLAYPPGESIDPAVTGWTFQGNRLWR
jgi:fibronectin type 3 domain-containing protein